MMEGFSSAPAADAASVAPPANLVTVMVAMNDMSSVVMDDHRPPVVMNDMSPAVMNDRRSPATVDDDLSFFDRKLKRFGLYGRRRDRGGFGHAGYHAETQH